MPLFMDRHDLAGATPADLAQAHICDLRLQDRYGVRFITYWHHTNASTSFCLFEAPTPEVAERVHAEAHGQLASRIIPVEWEAVESFLGAVHEPREGEPWVDSAKRTLLCADAEGVPSAWRGQGGRSAVARGATVVRGGASGVLSCFSSVSAALECALALQQSFVPLTSMYDGSPVEMRIGISVGLPVPGHFGGLFGDALDVAVDLCKAAPPGATLVSEEVYVAAAGCPFRFSRWQPELALVRAGAPAASFRLDGRLTRRTAPLSPMDRLEVAALSSRQIEILRLIAVGKTNKEIARSLFISENTVATHIRNIFERTGVANRAEAASFAHRHTLA